VHDAIAGSDDTVFVGTDSQGAVSGNGDTIKYSGDGDQISLSGSGDTADVYVNDSGEVFSGSGDTIDLGNDVKISITGSNDVVKGSSGDTIHDSGQDDNVYATNSTIDFSGNNSGDEVHGTGDTGSDWGGHSSGGGGSGGLGSGSSDALSGLTKLGFAVGTAEMLHGQSGAVLSLIESSFAKSAAASIAAANHNALEHALSGFGLPDAIASTTKTSSRTQAEALLAAHH
jgi:hypothetical protein